MAIAFAVLAVVSACLCTIFAAPFGWGAAAVVGLLAGMIAPLLAAGAMLLRAERPAGTAGCASGALAP